MTRYAAEVSYDGGKFFGWQVQPGLPTVQLALENALSLINGSAVAVAGAGRTDAGVHARAQVCSFDMACEWEPRRLVLAVNAHLPEGVSVMRAAAAPEDFHARFCAKEREYRYFIWNESTIYPHLEGRVFWLKQKRFDWGRAAQAAKYLLGTHDFANFSHAEESVKDTFRTITRIRLYRRPPLIVFQIRGDGFLHNMVRITLGNMELAASGLIEPHEITGLLDRSKTRSDGGRTYPACGLYLWKIGYRGDIWKKAAPRQPALR
ncbi:tRNA pseudouridine(38-40) synthase TruA [Synergistes jonesii]|uniref:tRNA pseudouridine(38-40) synthase TruA n=1 Tax=Synergistes jonesii TaxID=2754 RepID=UPI0024323AF3|nr:tRNA pseudouridine(38-40) synthase TruA [Synergistes jonesii]